MEKRKGGSYFCEVVGGGDRIATGLSIVVDSVPSYKSMGLNDLGFQRTKRQHELGPIIWRRVLHFNKCIKTWLKDKATCGFARSAQTFDADGDDEGEPQINLNEDLNTKPYVMSSQSTPVDVGGFSSYGPSPTGDGSQPLGGMSLPSARDWIIPGFMPSSSIPGTEHSVPSAGGQPSGYTSRSNDSHKNRSIAVERYKLYMDTMMKMDRYWDDKYIRANNPALVIPHPDPTSAATESARMREEIGEAVAHIQDMPDISDDMQMRAYKKNHHRLGSIDIPILPVLGLASLDIIYRS